MLNASIIAAMDNNRVIGKDNKLPWHIPEDLRRFKKLTEGKIVIMGRKTHESIGKPLLRRIGVVVTHSETSLPGVHTVASLDAAINFAFILEKKFNLDSSKEIMIIGGESIYRQAINFVSKMYITIVNGAHEGDTFFPKIDLNIWKIIEQEDFPLYSFLTYKRI
jgi:dihydrofolate reductase